jgi:hypothetical protein
MADPIPTPNTAPADFLEMIRNNDATKLASLPQTELAAYLLQLGKVTMEQNKALEEAEAMRAEIEKRRNLENEAHFEKAEAFKNQAYASILESANGDKETIDNAERLKSYLDQQIKASREINDPSKLNQELEVNRVILAHGERSRKMAMEKDKQASELMKLLDNQTIKSSLAGLGSTGTSLVNKINESSKLLSKTATQAPIPVSTPTAPAPLSDPETATNASTPDDRYATKTGRSFSDELRDEIKGGLYNGPGGVSGVIPSVKSHIYGSRVHPYGNPKPQQQQQLNTNNPMGY